MVFTHEPTASNPKLLVRLRGSGRIPRFPPPPGKVIPGGEGVGVVFALHPLLVDQ
jgi:hypothetical protein